MITLTSSSMSALFSCPRRYFLAYERGWRREEASEALRFGSAFHAGLEARANGASCNDAVAAAISTCAGIAPSTVLTDSEMSVTATLTALLRGYYARWNGRETVTRMHPEIEFSMRLDGLRGVIVRGKIDGVCEFEDGRTGIIEHKTTSEDIAPGSPYWDGINRDQIALYGIAAERHGWPVDCYLYDVIRKPSIRQGKSESPAEFAARLAADCVDSAVAAPTKTGGVKLIRHGADWYFGRREIGITELDKARMTRRVAVAATMVRERRRQAARFGAVHANEAWPRCGSTLVCRSCQFRGVCEMTELPVEHGWMTGGAFRELSSAAAK